MEKRLTRVSKGKMISGVAAGLELYSGLDATLIRLLFVVATFFGGGGLLVYIVMAIVMPLDDQVAPGSQASGASPGTTSPGVASSAAPGAASGQAVGQQKTENPSGKQSAAAVVGWVLVGLGLFFLANEFLAPFMQRYFYWLSFDKLWPLAFIAVGAIIISSASKKTTDGQGAGPGPSPEAGPSASPEAETTGSGASPAAPSEPVASGKGQSGSTPSGTTSASPSGPAGSPEPSDPPSNPMS